MRANSLNTQFKNLTKDYAFMFKKWNTLGIKSKEYCLGT